MIPILHRNSSLANQTVCWHGTDQEEVYKKNLKINLAELQSNNWVDRPITYKFNSYGFRADEFESPGSNVMFIGCSHTEGTATPLELTWGSVLEKQLKIQIVNLGVGSSNAVFCKKNIMSWVTSRSLLPKFVVVQWPNPFRLLSYSRMGAEFELLNGTDGQLINTTLKMSENNFLESWLSAIIDTNNILQLLNIPCYNIHFQTQQDFQIDIVNILKQHHIKIYLNENITGVTWLLDSNAYDKSHHSTECQQQWADRLTVIINENPTR